MLHKILQSEEKGKLVHTSWNALECALHASEPPTLFMVGADEAAASEATVSCWMVRGPITASTALCATALPVPKAIPMIREKETVCHICTWIHSLKENACVMIKLHAYTNDRDIRKRHLPWAMVAPSPPSIDPPPPPWTGAGGGAWLTASTKQVKLTG